jgi:hypothetical protein
MKADQRGPGQVKPMAVAQEQIEDADRQRG